MPKAPRRCPGGRGTCTNLIRHTRYCPDHTVAWQGPRTESSKATSTSAWQRIRLEILERDNYQCQIRGPKCTGRATQVDKIKPAASGRVDIRHPNLRAACEPCNQHKARTSDRK